MSEEEPPRIEIPGTAVEKEILVDSRPLMRQLLKMAGMGDNCLCREMVLVLKVGKEPVLFSSALLEESDEPLAITPLTMQERAAPIDITTCQHLGEFTLKVPNPANKPEVK